MARQHGFVGAPKKFLSQKNWKRDMPRLALCVAVLAACLAGSAAFTAAPALALHGVGRPLAARAPQRAGLVRLAMQEEVRRARSRAYRDRAARCAPLPPLSTRWPLVLSSPRRSRRPALAKSSRTSPGSCRRTPPTRTPMACASSRPRQRRYLLFLCVHARTHARAHTHVRARARTHTACMHAFGPMGGVDGIACCGGE